MAYKSVLTGQKKEGEGRHRERERRGIEGRGKKETQETPIHREGKAEKMA